MKEVTEWDGNPRWMWVWDNDANRKEKRYVLCILTDEEMKESKARYPVCTYNANYTHCAEIEEEKRPCTREELLEMLKKQGLSVLYCKENDNTYTIIHLNDERITIISVLGSSLTYDYRELCETFTLLDGTELWIKE